MYNYNLPSKSIIYSHISVAMKRQVNDESIEIVSVNKSTVGKGNTEILLRALDTGIFTGERLYYYNRVDINNITDGLTLSVPYDNYVNSYEVLSALNAKYGFALTFDEVVKEEYDKRRHTYYELQIAPNSYVWTGTLKVHKDAAPNSLAKLLSPDSLTAPLVTGYKRGKLTGELLYKPYEFNSIRADLEKLVEGKGQEFAILAILKQVIADPWEYQKGVATPWNLLECRVEKSRRGVYSVVKIYLSNYCTLIDGFIELKYL